MRASGLLFEYQGAEGKAVLVERLPDSLMIMDAVTHEVQGYVMLSHVARIEHPSPTLTRIVLDEVEHNRAIELHGNYDDRAFKFDHGGGGFDLRPKRRNAWLPAIIVLSIMGFIIAGGAVVYYWALPNFSNWVVDYIPDETERHWGKLLDEQLKASGAFAVDPVKTKALQELLKEVNFEDPEPTQFQVAFSPQVNAFMTPGGYGYVLVPLIEKIENADEFLAVIGHEYGHYQKRHSLKQVVKSLSLGILIGGVTGNTAGLTEFIQAHAVELAEMGYSREAELEADIIGADFLIHNQLDPMATVRLFANFEKIFETKGADISFYDTHPSNTERLHELQQYLKGRAYQVDAAKKQRIDSLYNVLRTQISSDMVGAKQDSVGGKASESF